MAVSRSALSRQIALDHILRRLIQQNPRQPASMQLWSSIARLIPGVTVQHCVQRWQELCKELSAASEQTQLEAMGRPISSQPRVLSTRSVHQLNQSSNSSVVSSSSQPSAKEGGATKRPKMVDTKHGAVEQGAGSKEGGVGTEEGGDTKREAKTTTKDAGDVDTLQSNKSTSSSAVLEEVSPLHAPDTTTTASAPVDSPDSQMVTIHVCDDAKNVKQDFVCCRTLLVEEMVYFANYLSNQPSEGKAGVDISVHCDVAIFTWLISYIKRGMNEDPFGKSMDQPQETPSLTPENAISVLISSEFLKMAALVEMCLEYIHSHLSAVLSAKCNVSCIPDHLVTRLAHRFTPMQLEAVQDKRDKFRNKLYFKKLVDLFKPTFSAPYSPHNAADLYRCLHCHTLLMADQEAKLPCSSKRVSVSEAGEVVYHHQMDPQWEINSYLSQLLARGRTIREVYWMVWGVVNTLVCNRCGQLFQCRLLQQHCRCHPLSPTPGLEGSSGLVYPCCGRRQQPFRLLDTPPDGCQLSDHCVTAVNGAAGTSDVGTVLLAHQDMICIQDTETAGDRASISDEPTLHNLLSSTTSNTVLHGANPVLWDPKRTVRWNQDRQREQGGVAWGGYARLDHTAHPLLHTGCNTYADQQRIRELTKRLREMAGKEKLTV